MAALNVLPPQHYVGAVESMPLIVDLIEHLRDAKPSIQWTTASSRTCTSHRRVTRSSVHSPIFLRMRLLRSLPSAAVIRIGWARRPLGLPGLAPRPGGEPSWESVLGAGRPGWHIECTAIALDRLGPGFDVQAGGSDLIFPHHEMCAAQGRVATDQPFAQAYLHSGMVGLDGEKMSKSKGNLVFVSCCWHRG